MGSHNYCGSHILYIIPFVLWAQVSHTVHIPFVLWAHIFIVGLTYCTLYPFVLWAQVSHTVHIRTLGTVGLGLPYCTYTLGTVGSHNYCRSPILYIYSLYCGLTYCRSPMFSVCVIIVLLCMVFCNLISAASKKTPLHHSKLKFSSVTSVCKRVGWSCECRVVL